MVEPRRGDAARARALQRRAGHRVLRHGVGLLRLWGDDGVEDVQDGDVLAGDLELLLHVLVDQLKVFRCAPLFFLPGEVAIVKFL